jgi:hypothetical protein
MLAGLIVDLGQDITKGFLARKSVDEKWKLDLLCHTFKFKVDAGPELRQKKKKKGTAGSPWTFGAPHGNPLRVVRIR